MLSRVQTLFVVAGLMCAERKGRDRGTFVLSDHKVRCRMHPSCPNIPDILTGLYQQIEDCGPSARPLWSYS